MISKDVLKQLLEESRTSQINFLKDDVTVLKLIETEPFAIRYYTHFEEKRGNYVCRKSLGDAEKCYLCEKKLRLVKRHLIFAVHITQQPQLKIFALPITVMEQLIKLLLSDDWKGLTERESELIVIQKEGQSLRTRYNVSVTKKTYQHDIEDLKSLNLNDYLKVPSYEEQKQEFEAADSIPF